MSNALVPTTTTELATVWQQMSPNRKIGLGIVLAAAIAGLIFFVSWAQTPEYGTAFTDLSAEDGGAIVSYLQENNIAYEITNGGATIRVPSERVHEVRLALAGQGLPSQGTVGFELFDTANLSLTDFTQQVNYQRALEGELSRTISSLTAVKAARMHIVIPQQSLFSEDQLPTTASVVVDLESGQSLNREQVRAISHLVSSAVEGLTPENLTIVDMDGNVLADGSGTESGSAIALSGSQLETQRSVERDLERRIETMLENVLGRDRAVVRVTADMNWDQIQMENETYYPGQQDGVLRSSRIITETYGAGVGEVGGIPGVDSNVPDAAPAFQTEISGTTDSAYLRNDITTNYEVSRSYSQVISATGRIDRLSISVLVDNITDTLTIDAIQQATVAAAGIDQNRGDILTVNSIAFDRSLETEEAVAQEEAQQMELYFKIAQWGAVGIALLALFFVVRGMQRSLNPVPIIEEETQDPRAALLDQVELGAGFAEIGPPSLDPSQKVAAEKAQMLRQLQLMAKGRPEALAQIIQFWLTEDGQKA
ncbi:MAG: flagellar M-ring protein FliF [Anaerolineae bacterium]|nr:flagellar M-ring protein FliF [Anaerolineae bacterium]